MLTMPFLVNDARLGDLILTPAKGAGDAATRNGKRASAVASGSCIGTEREKAWGGFLTCPETTRITGDPTG